jgi:hypothetical protein
MRATKEEILNRRIVVPALVAGCIALISPLSANGQGLTEAQGDALAIGDLTTGAATNSSLITITFLGDFTDEFGYGALRNGSVVIKLTFESDKTRTLTISGPAEAPRLESSERGDLSFADRDGRRLFVEASGFDDPLKRIDVKTLPGHGGSYDHVIRKPVALLSCTRLERQKDIAFDSRSAANRTASYLSKRERELGRKLAEAEDAGDTQAIDRIEARLDRVDRKRARAVDETALWDRRFDDLQIALRDC